MRGQECPRYGQYENCCDRQISIRQPVIMGRMATCTGQAITWKQALNSKEDLSPERYDWNAKLPVSEVAMPGLTKAV